MSKEKTEVIMNGIESIVCWVAIIVLLIIVSLKSDGLALFNKQKDNNTYYRSAIVIETRGTEVLLEDTTGNIWSIEDSSLQKYGRYILKMDNNGTDSIYDDEILSAD